jgi:hypothetical protein
VRRLLALVIVLTAAAAVVPTLPAAAGAFGLDIDLLSPVEPLTFEATFPGDNCVDGPFAAAVESEDTGAVTPLSVIQDPVDPNRFVFVLPSDTTPGQLTFEIECDDGDGTGGGSGDILFGALAVTKVVVGPAPPDTSFVVNVGCVFPVGEMASEAYGGPGVAGLTAEQDFVLAYPAAGGVRYVYFLSESECLITEPVNGGAASTTIVPAEILNEEPDLYESTVTNTFAAVVEPTFTG